MPSTTRGTNRAGNRATTRNNKVQSVSPESSIDAFLRTHRGAIVIALCAYAAVRILVFCAAYPLFNNIDEPFHFVSIRNLAEGRLPGKELPPFDLGSARTLVLYGTPEYLNPERVLRKYGTPVYQLPAPIQDSVYRAGIGIWTKTTNLEAQSPPLYYAVAAVWYKLGTILGWQDWKAAYWIRFLNPIAFALLVWFAYRFVSLAYPENAFLQVAVPALIAVFPQDVFFGMNRDVFSATFAAAALLCMLKAVKTEVGGDRLMLAGAFLVGLAFLVNTSNCVLYGALAVALWLKLRTSKEPLSRHAWKITASMAASLVLPALWMLRNYLVMGDLTGSSAKIARLGWTLKPWQDILDHPMFSPSGLFYFLVELTQRFWRGELVWHMAPQRSAFSDAVYVYTSFLLVLIFVVHFARQRKTAPALEKLASLQALFVVGGSVLFMAVISLPFDFHDCVYPSTRYPFFISGRIIACAILPFVLIYTRGLELLTSRLRISPAIPLAGLMIFITVSEFVLRSAVFSSHFNYFAFSSWKG